MPFTNRPPHLKQIWVSRPVFFVTCVTNNRTKYLADHPISSILIQDWNIALSLYGWAVGEYVIMPDHVHFFCREATNSKLTLPEFIGRWKQFTARKIGILLTGKSMKVWQDGFFDRLMREESEWEEKRIYMLNNPIRAGLANEKNEWAFQGDLDMFREM